MDSKRFQTIVVGTGAAGYSAAWRLHQHGVKDIAIVTERVNAGTSRNTGSDKQTYYKLSVAGGGGDSVLDMAQTLFDGQAVDGDIALCEAAYSLPSFFRLADLGVPFPKNQYGEFVGYKTDHDPRTRATSVGPYTSKMMTEALEREVKRHNIPVLDELQAIRVLVAKQQVVGLLCLNRCAQEDPEHRFVAIACKNIILATGGPAGIYRDTVYPASQFGGSALAFRIGAAGRNLTEWQYGLASVSPKWNVSGSYMQVLPRFVSTDENGQDEKEFLYDHFSDEGQLLTNVFLKGYQWPFDVRKVEGGSSVIDVLVYLECQKGRRVYLDFRKNPQGRDIDFTHLSEEAYQYLHKAGACFGTPYERLLQINAPAAEFYAEHGVSLKDEMLEIALCAQHNNGGVAVDNHWKTSVSGLFVVGEAAGTHGVYRPGGSALNSGQVGAERAAEYIAAYGSGSPDEAAFEAALAYEMENVQSLCDAVMGAQSTCTKIWKAAQERMSRFGAAFRSEKNIRAALAETVQQMKNFKQDVKISEPGHLPLVFRLEDMLLTQQMYLAAMLDYIKELGKSRGSALYMDSKGNCTCPKLPEEFTFSLDDGSRAAYTQEIVLRNGETVASWRRVHPIPQEDDVFENVWRTFRENGNVNR